MKAASKEKGQSLSVYLKYSDGNLVEQALNLPQWVDRIAQEMGTSAFLVIENGLLNPPRCQWTNKALNKPIWVAFSRPSMLMRLSGLL
ncbi:hypothetical protein [Mucilaginibacter sp. OK283]|uniref:hypothetical protein n=1 Tax=Mucilaginibacter sp. OK283 TaxID=1881049 RepID=UPI0008D89606|nr:hypothetical protein [Mucilaginibacter sp. OK283]SEO93367.1 hypothetical protein SAMN05428947_105124 [Mucilaginibacter sp. OK283]